MPIKIENHKPGKDRKTTFNLDFLQKEIGTFGSKFSNKTKEQFYLELSILTKSGVNLKEALHILETSFKKKQHQQVVQQIASKIVSGASLSEAIKSFSFFSDYEFYALKIGEESGSLKNVFELLYEYYFKRNEQKKNIINALTYPIIIVSTALLVVGFMLKFVVPMFEDLFQQQSLELPAITVFIINTSNFFNQYFYLFILGFIVVLVVNFYFKNNLFLLTLKHKIVLSLPFFKGFVKIIVLAQFTQAMAMLSSSKTPLVDALGLAKDMISYIPFKENIQGIVEKIEKGETFHNSTKKYSFFFDSSFVAMVKVGEETNNMPFIFKKLNEQYAEQLRLQSKNLSNVLEPLIIVVIGLLVGVILVSMYLPMFKLSTVIG